MGDLAARLVGGARPLTRPLRWLIAIGRVLVVVGRGLSAGLAILVGVVLSLHVCIVAAYGGGSGEAVAGVLLGAAIVVTLIAMWTLERPRSQFARTAACLALAATYLVVFVVIV